MKIKRRKELETKRIKKLSWKAERIQKMLFCIFRMNKVCKRNQITLNSVEDVENSLKVWTMELEACLKTLEGYSEYLPGSDKFHFKFSERLSLLNERANYLKASRLSSVSHDELLASQCKLRGGTRARVRTQINAKPKQVVVENNNIESGDIALGFETTDNEADSEMFFGGSPLPEHFKQVKNSLVIAKNKQRKPKASVSEGNSPKVLTPTRVFSWNEPFLTPMKPKAVGNVKAQPPLTRTEILLLELNDCGDKTHDITNKCNELKQDENFTRDQIENSKKKKKLLRDDIHQLEIILCRLESPSKNSNPNYEQVGLEEICDEYIEKIALLVNRRTNLDEKINEIYGAISYQKEETKRKFDYIRSRINPQDPLTRIENKPSLQFESAISNYSVVKLREVHDERQRVSESKRVALLRFYNCQGCLCSLKRKNETIKDLISSLYRELSFTEKDMLTRRQELTFLVEKKNQTMETLEFLSKTHGTLVKVNGDLKQRLACINKQTRKKMCLMGIPCDSDVDLDKINTTFKARKASLDNLLKKIEKRKSNIHCLSQSIEMAKLSTDAMSRTCIRPVAVRFNCEDLES